MVDVSFFPYGAHEAWDLMPGMVQRAYPEYMNHGAIADRCFPLMYDLYPEWQQLAVVDGNAIGFFNSVPLPFDGPDEDLPNTGWDWAIDLATRERVEAATTASAIQIVIDPNYHGHGYSRMMVSQMKANAVARGCHRLVVPLRPTGKPDYPRMTMAE